MKIVVVERIMDPPVSPEQAAEMIAEGDPCLAVRRVRHLRTYLAPDGIRTVCVFLAPDAETVRDGFRASGKSFERAWVAEVVVGPDGGEEQA